MEANVGWMHDAQDKKKRSEKCKTFPRIVLCSLKCVLGCADWDGPWVVPIERLAKKASKVKHCRLEAETRTMQTTP